MRPRSTLFAFLLLLPCAAFADGDPAKGGPARDGPAGEQPAADPAAGTGSAEGAAGSARERKVDAAALERLTGWAAVMHLPSNGTADHVGAHARAGGSVFGAGDLVVRLDWKREEGLKLDVTASEAMKKQVPPEAQKAIRNLFAAWGREALAPVFETPQSYARDYDVGLGKKGETTFVELLPYNEHAKAELQRMWFAENGLCERRILIPRVDPSDPMQQMMVGAEIESSFGYEKVGDRFLLVRMSMLTPVGDLLVAYEYHTVTDGPPLLAKVVMTTPFAPDPIEVVFSDYTRDGALVELPKPAATEPQPAEDGEEPEKTDDPERPAK